VGVKEREKVLDLMGSESQSLLVPWGLGSWRKSPLFCSCKQISSLFPIGSFYFL